MGIGLASQFAVAVFYVDFYPLFLDLGGVHCKGGVVTDNFEAIDVEMHDIFEGASFSFVEGAVEPDFISVFEVHHRLAVVVEDVGVDGDEGVGFVVFVLSGFHLHEHVDGVEIPLVLVLPVVLQLEEMSLPIFELLGSIFVQTKYGLVFMALLEIFGPGRCYKFIGVFVV